MGWADVPPRLRGSLLVSTFPPGLKAVLMEVAVRGPPSWGRPGGGGGEGGGVLGAVGVVGDASERAYLRLA